MSQATLTPDYHLCETPPPTKTAPTHLGLEHLDYDTLNSSPVTPYSHPSAPSQLRPPTEAEAQRYTQMLLGAKRHRSFSTTLIKRTQAVGNGLYLEKRPIIVSWLVDVCRSFMFQPQTLHLAVRHMDWFMALHRLEQGSWQLCAVAAVFLAAKCEEAGNHVPVLDTLKSICEHIYDDESIRRMELCMLAVLKWDLVVKGPVHFLYYFLSVLGDAVKDREEENRKISLARAKLSFSSDQDGENEPYDTLNSFDMDDLEDDEYYPSEMEECDCYENCACDDRFSEDDYETNASNESQLDSLVCDEEMSVDLDAPLDSASDQTSARNKCNEEHFSKPESRRDVVDDLMGIAECVLDSSLFDPSVTAYFPPQVIAASALVVAIEASGETRIQANDVLSVSDLCEEDTSECCRVLFELFEDSFEKNTSR